jgi:hypothetical protein
MERVGETASEWPPQTSANVHMFTAATKPIVNRAAMWLASVTLLWPVPMQQRCDCDRGHSECCGQSKQVLQRGTGHCSYGHPSGSSISSPPQAAGACCCCTQTAASRANKSPCCRSAAKNSPAQGCCCGPTCTCQASQRPTQPRDMPTTNHIDVSWRIVLGQPLQAVAIVASAGPSACSETQIPCRLGSSSATDRCRALSRFTI